MIILFEVEVQNNFVFNAKIAKNRKNQAAAADYKSQCPAFSSE